MRNLFLCRLMLLATLSCILVTASQAEVKGKENDNYYKTNKIN